VTNLDALKELTDLTSLKLSISNSNLIDLSFLQIFDKVETLGINHLLPYKFDTLPKSLRELNLSDAVRWRYIATWIMVLKGDTPAIFSAAAHAQRAADYLHSLQPKQTGEDLVAAIGGPVCRHGLPRFIEIDGRRYLWCDLVALRRDQATTCAFWPHGASTMLGRH
jgi:hypothetical protein